MNIYGTVYDTDVFLGRKPGRLKENLAAGSGWVTGRHSVRYQIIENAGACIEHHDNDRLSFIRDTIFLASIDNLSNGGPLISFVLLLEGVSRLDAEEKHVIREMIEGMLVKHQTKQMVKNLAS